MSPPAVTDPLPAAAATHLLHRLRTRLTSSAEAVAEHEAQRGFKHRFVRLLKAGFFVAGEDFMGRSELLLGACNEALYLRPVNRVWLEFFQAVPTSGTRFVCQTFSRKASLRPRRDSSSFLVRTV
jgi:hypothetical protein